MLWIANSKKQRTNKQIQKDWEYQHQIKNSFSASFETQGFIPEHLLG
jgi:hypothetical protein